MFVMWIIMKYLLNMYYVADTVELPNSFELLRQQDSDENWKHTISSSSSSAPAPLLWATLEIC